MLAAVEKVQLALCPAGTASGSAVGHLIPVVGLKSTVCAAVSALSKTTVSPTVIESDAGLS